MLVQNAMVSEVECCTAKQNLEEIAAAMHQFDCGAIPIVDAQRKPIGIFTDRDVALWAALLHKPLWKIKAADVLFDQELQCCEPEDLIEDALAIMERYKIRRLPVTDESGMLIGMLSMGDIASYTYEHAKSDDNTIPSHETLLFLKSVSAHHNGALARADYQ